MSQVHPTVVNEFETGAALVLVVEDEVKLADVLVDYLQAAGYATHRLLDGLRAVESVRSLAPDLVLLDLTLPGRDGVEICREVRGFSEVPIVMVTARVEEIDRLLGLEVGADDYICKPFSPKEVVARVRTVLRRARNSAGAHTANDLALDEDGHRLCYKGHWVELTAIEFRLFRTLARSPGRVFSRDQLQNHLYTDHRLVADRTVDSHIKNLRRKLQLVFPEQNLVRSVYGVGYKYDA